MAAPKSTAVAVADGEAPPQKSGPSIVVQLGLLVVLTLAAAGMGWLSGGMLEQGEAGDAPANAGHAAPAADAHGGGGGGHGEAKEGEHGAEAPVNPLIVQLPIMTTNLAAPSEVWVRMEASLLLDSPQPEELAGQIHQDLLAYMRTLKMHQIEGASGFRHLREDLKERAAIRSDGHVKDVLIKTLLFE